MEDNEKAKSITLRCGCKGEILDDGNILITALCPSDAANLLEIEEADE